MTFKEAYGKGWHIGVWVLSGVGMGAFVSYVLVGLLMPVIEAVTGPQSRSVLQLLWGVCGLVTVPYFVGQMVDAMEKGEAHRHKYPEDS